MGRVEERGRSEEEKSKGEAKKERKVKRRNRKRRAKKEGPRRGAEQCVHFVTISEVGRTPLSTFFFTTSPPGRGCIGCLLICLRPIGQSHVHMPRSRSRFSRFGGEKSRCVQLKAFTDHGLKGQGPFEAQTREYENKGCLLSVSAWRLTDLADSKVQKLSALG